MCVCLISAYEKLEINYEKVCEYVITVITTRVQSWIKIYLKLGGRKCSVTLSRKRQKLGKYENAHLVSIRIKPN